MHDQNVPTIRNAVGAYEFIFCRYLILCFAILGIPTSVLSFLWGVPSIGYGAALFSCVSWTMYFLLIKSRKVALIAETYFAITFVTIYALAFVTGGIPGPMTYSFFLVPMMAMVCRGKHSSAAWAAITVVGILSFLFFTPAAEAAPTHSLRTVEIVLMLSTFLSIHLTSLAGRIFTEKSFDKLILEEQRKADLERQLIQASKLASLGTLGAGVAHELNNPLAAVIGFANIIKEKAEPNTENAVMAERIVKACKRMAAIVQHLRQFSRDSSKEPKRPVDFAQVIKDSLILFEKQLNFRGIQVEVNGPSTFVLGDANQLESVIQNLLSNSRDAFEMNNVKEDKRISMRILPERDWLTFEYMDNAGGMSEEVVSRIYDPFFTTKAAGLGTGLGMSISYDIIKKHGGSIQVSSQWGTGTTFRISLPLHAAPAETERPIVTDADTPTSPAAPKPAPHEEGKRPHLLLVDDEPDLVSILTMILEDDFVIDAFTDGRSAVQALANKSYDYILTDLRMPYFTGLKIIEVARKHQPKSIVFVISGHAADSEEAQEALHAGAAGVIRKPLPEASELVDLMLSSKKHVSDVKAAG